MSQEGFLFANADALMPFWRAVRMFKIDKEEDRVTLLRKCVARHRAKYIRDPKILIKGKRVIKIERKSTEPRP